MRKVLIADDSDLLRSLLLATLDTGGFELLEAADGHAALRIALAERPDLAFLDWQMPGITGLDVVKALRADERTRAMKIVMLTAHQGEEARRTALAAGADDFIAKPFSPLELLDTVAAVLGPGSLL